MKEKITCTCQLHNNQSMYILGYYLNGSDNYERSTTMIITMYHDKWMEMYSILLGLLQLLLLHTTNTTTTTAHLDGPMSYLEHVTRSVMRTEGKLCSTAG